MTALYDTFYYSTLCHVCKSYDSVSDHKLKRCGGCKLISYCSTQHQKLHWPVHKRLCKCVQSVLKSRRMQNLFQDGIQKTSLEDWRKLRTSLMLLVQLNMVRKLRETEQQMFLFPRVCELCREATQENLIDCQHCYSVSYCYTVHQEEDSVRHEGMCRQLALCLFLNKYFLEERDPYSVIKLPVQHIYKYLPLNMEVFINQFFSNHSFHEIAILSEFLSCPLTLIYALEKLKMKPKNTLDIHVVGAGLIECTYLHKWETILHYIPDCVYLRIVLIGPEIEKELEPYCELCKDCQESGKNLNIIFLYGKLYHEYASSDMFSKPDIIMAYNCGFHEYENSDNDTWLLSIPYLIKHKYIPLVITSYTRAEAEKDIARVLDFRDTDLEVILKCSENPFGSMRPYRDWNNADSKVFFVNKFINIVRPC